MSDPVLTKTEKMTGNPTFDLVLMVMARIGYNSVLFLTRLQTFEFGWGHYSNKSDFLA